MKKNLLFSLLLINLQLFSQSGISWSAPVNVAMSMYGNLHPRLALNAAGEPLVLWGQMSTDQANFSKWNGTAFTTPVALNPGSLPVSVFSWAGPDIVSRGDTVYVVYKQTPEDTSNIYMVRSFNGGASFSMPVPISSIADSVSRFPTATIDPYGNPIVAFMKFNSDFSNARWVVCRSPDYGSTFSVDVKASNSSGGEVCDCCPGAIVSSGNTVALLGRANATNVRDIWADVSSDNGSSFSNGMNVDQHNWYLTSCPSSGPDAFILDDTLYSVFMNGAGGYRVYTNRNSLSTFASGVSTAITGPITGLSQQNYPRISNYGTAAAMVWRQVISGSTHLSLLFTSDIHAGFPAAFDTIAMGGAGTASNGDVVVSNGVVHVVWENDITGTVQYRKGIIGAAGVNESVIRDLKVSVYPNPANNVLTIALDAKSAEVVITDILGRTLQRKKFDGPSCEIETSTLAEGQYAITVICNKGTVSKKFIVSH